MIALLAFILGIWLWDHYFGKPAGYLPGTEQVALVKIDRDLRLADAMVEDPSWLRWLVGVEEPAAVRGNAIEVFQKLAVEHAISLSGLEAFAIVKSVHDGLPMAQSLAQVLQGQMISDYAETSRALASHRGTWWHAKLIEDWEKQAQPAAHWRQSFGEDSVRLRSRAIVARSAIWLLGLAGLVMLPHAIRRWMNAPKAKSMGYAGAWPLPFGLVVFMVATLAWIGFSTTLELGISTLAGLPPILGIFLDSVARMLPALIALGLIFRRPGHAVRVLGLNRSVDFRSVLAVFALLLIVDQGLRSLFGSAGANVPGGGLSAGDAGWWGLSFVLMSACVLAPLAEEILYRGVLFRSLWNRIGLIPAAVCSSAVFAILHFYDGYGLASVGVFGFTCALLYAKSGSLAMVIVLHMLYNLSIKIPEWIVYHAPLG